MNDNQYIIYLVKPAIPKVNVKKNLTPEFWHTWLSHLSYGAMQKLVSIASGIEFKRPILSEICGNYIVGQQQC